MIYFCCTDVRRELVKQSPNLNGIDFLEVLDDPARPNNQRQRKLFVHFLKPLAANTLKKENIRIEGGERITNIGVVAINASVEILTVDVDKPGDFSIYTLRLLKDASSTDPDEPPPDGFDPVLSVVQFSFKVECPNDFDCKATRECPPESHNKPELDYLAKDYNSFRQLMLDRMSTAMPQWRERNAADLGIALVELLACVGDHLSYQQDAIATEAYLGTALHRVSARRLARLVDYRMHDGCNARAWVAIKAANGINGIVIPGPLPQQPGTKLLTRTSAPPGPLPEGQVNEAVNEGAFVFETMYDLMLYEAHNEIKFYTWGETECCLPKRATHATLLDDANKRLRLCVGDVLIFEERLGPKTGAAADADPAHRQAVRLTRVTPEAKPIFKITDDSLAAFKNEIPAIVVNQLGALKNQEFADEQTFVSQLRNTIGENATNNYEGVINQFSANRSAAAAGIDPLTNELVVEIEWAQEDELTFPLSISSKTDQEHGVQEIADVSIVLGNIVLCDHGLTETNRPIPDTVPDPTIFRPAINGDPCAQTEPVPVPHRYRPVLKDQPLTFAAPFDSTASVGSAMNPDIRTAMPQIFLRSSLNTDTATWTAQRDLLGSDIDKTEFVAEVDNDGTACLRFGDDEHGRRPDSGTTFTATYRVGNGASGNVGADSMVHIVSDDQHITSVRNPLAALGGVEPESIEDVRQRAPYAFRIQERAVTADDYAMMAHRDARVQRAAGTFRWTGSWRTMFVTIDPFGGTKMDDAFKQAIEAELEHYRMAGQDLDVNGPIYVSLDIEMQVCVKRDYFRSAVKQALLEIFSKGVLPDGRLGVFNPDKFTFGQTVYLSPLYFAAQAVDGVESVVITKFRRQGTDSDVALNAGRLDLARLEIARCDNDPDFPEHGVFKLKLDGGK